MKKLFLILLAVGITTTAVAKESARIPQQEVNTVYATKFYAMEERICVLEKKVSALIRILKLFKENDLK